MGIRLDLLPEHSHEPINAARRDELVVSPDRIEDGLTGQGRAGLLQEEMEEIEFLWREFDFLPGTREAPGRDIEPAITE